MKCKITTIFVGMFALADVPALCAEGSDSLRTVDIDDITITASSPKEHVRLREQPLSANLFDEKMLRNHHVESLKGVSALTPNLFIPEYGSSLTSAIYIRGIGSRINTPAVGLYVDNIPYIDKSAFDFTFLDIERMDVLRGPQGTLYGRNTMGGLIRIHTRNPLHHQGTELRLSAATGDNSGLLSLTHRRKINDRLALSLGGWMQEKRGFFRHDLTGRWTDPKRAGGAHLRTLFFPTENLKLDFTADYSHTDEGGYAYRYMGAVNPEEETYPELKGLITANRQAGYWRSLFNTGLHAEWRLGTVVLNSVTGYQHVNDAMHMDQDFLDADIFTLTQRQRQHTLTQEFTLKSHTTERWRHTTGISGFHQWADTEAPVNFYADGVGMIQSAMDAGMANSPVKVTLTDERIHIPGDFDTPVAGGAVFHQSDIALTPQLTLTAGVRADYEYLHITYDTRAKIAGKMTGMGFTQQPFTQEVEYADSHHKDHLHLLPKLALTYSLGRGAHKVYASFSKGLRSGGYNIQMFSEIIQGSFRSPSSSTESRSEEVEEQISYAPEYSWNYEAGAHLNFAEGSLQADVALFYTDIHDQQISRFTQGGLGRIMVNAGRGESYGAELSLRLTPHPRWTANLNYGYTHATFRKYDGGTKSDTGEAIDYSGNRIPFVPEHTLSTGASYHLPTPWGGPLRSLLFRASLTGTGRIYWTEQNNAWQNFYALLDGGITLDLAPVQIDLWGRNLTDTEFDTFYFESMSRGFAQQGRPFQLGVDVKIAL